MEIDDEWSAVLSAAKTICNFREGRSLRDISRDIFGSYETLLDVVGGPHAAGKISGLLNVPEAGIRSDAQKIIDFLLFNSENDPYITLGLPEHASAPEVNRRWKNLIVLYHPDKYRNQPGYEERAKRINEAYEKIHSTGGTQILPKKNAAIRAGKTMAGRSGGPGRIRRFRYLKYLPDFILALAVITAIILTVVFIGYLRHPPAQPQAEEQEQVPK